MKLKYFFCFYKYLIICILCYLFGNIGLFILSSVTNNKIIDIIIAIVLVVGNIFFIYKMVNLLRYMPQHFREYKKVCKMIEENTAKGLPIKKSDLYLLGMTNCGNELIKVVTDKYNIKL